MRNRKVPAEVVLRAVKWQVRTLPDAACASPPSKYPLEDHGQTSNNHKPDDYPLLSLLTLNNLLP